MKKIKSLFFTIYLVFSIFHLHAKEDNNMNILQNKPVFELKIAGLGAMYFIELNGVRVFKQYSSEGKVQARLPINHYMKSGENTIKILSWSGDKSPINPHAYVNVELIVSDNNHPENEFTVTALRFDNTGPVENKTVTSSLAGKYNSLQGFIAEDVGDVTIGEVVSDQVKNVFTYTRNVTIPSSLPLWAFFTSDEFPHYASMGDDEYYQNVDNLLTEYLKVQNAIENKDISSILPMFEERNKELDAAFYYAPGTHAKKIGIALNDAANDETATLVGLKSKSVVFDTSKNNKLNRLARKRKNSAIVLNYNEIEGSYRFDMIFRLKDGKWILTR